MDESKTTEPLDIEEVEDDGTELEDSDITFDGEDDSEDDATSEESEQDEEEDQEEVEEEDTPTVDEEEESTDEATPEEDTPVDTDEARKAHNREMAQARLKEKAEREATLRQQQQEYIAEADPEDPQDLALRQVQVDAYNNKVAINSNTLTNGYERAVNDFELLRDPAPEVQARIGRAIDTFEALHVKTDKYGNPIEVTGDLYTYLQTEVDSIQQLQGIGARKQVEAKAKEQSKAVTLPTRAPKPPKVDPDLEGFDEEANRY